ARVVALYAPRLRGGLRLPRYTHPEVIWQCTPACDPTFAAAMRTGWARLNLMDRRHWGAGECLLLQYQGLHGLGKMYQKGRGATGARRTRAEHQREGVLLQTAVANLIGDKVFALLGPDEVAQWWP